MLAGQVMWLGSNMKMNELWYRVQVKVYHHICNEVGQSPWDSEAGQNAEILGSQIHIS